MPIIANDVLDDPLLMDGNDSFVGGQVSATRDDLVPPNSYAEGKNIDLDAFGNAVTRRGAELSLGYLIWEDVDTNWEAESNTWNSTTAPVASCTYFDTGTNQYIIMADGEDFLKAMDSAGAITEITAATYPSGATVRFAQIGTRLYFTDESSNLRYIDSALANNAISAGTITSIEITTQGLGYTSVPTITFSSGAATATANLGYGGKVVSATVTDGSSGYSTTTPPTISLTDAPTGGTDAVGIAKVSQTPSKPKLLVGHTNRLFATSADTSVPADLIYVSDILDGESWDLAGNSIRIGTDGDPIVAMMPWQDFNLLVFKERSIWMVTADPIQEVSDWTIKLVNNRVGCVAEKTVQQAGADVLFLSRNGLQSVQTIQAGTQTDISLPISSPINDYMGRINQTYIGLSCAAYWRNRYMLAVPLDSATTPDTVLTYHLLAKAWTGFWTGWEPREFVVTALSSELKLNWGDQGGNFYTWDDTKPDADTTEADYKDGGVAYESYILTRAYRFGETWGDKIGYSAQFNLENIHSTAVTSNFSYYKDLSVSANTLAADVSLSASTNLIRKGYNLIPKGRFNQMQFKAQADGGRLALHSIQAAAFGQPIKPER